MLHVALLAAALSVTEPSSTVVQSPVQTCFASMDGAVYHGDPTDRVSMSATLRSCLKVLAKMRKIRITSQQGPQKLYITARLLDRAATLSYIGLGQTREAFEEARMANLYFRIAAGLQHQSNDYRAAALANVALTDIQLQTLRSDIAAATKSQTTTVALRPKS